MDSDSPIRYRIDESDRAEADRSSAYLSIQYRNGPDFAEAWHNGLLEAITTLADFPGPRANPIIRERTPDRPEIRRLLYRGPGKRRSRMQPGYRILYTIIEIPDDPESIIRILRILHTAVEALD